VALSLRKNPNKAYDDLKELASKARRHQDREAWLNIAFYNNEQYVTWSDDTANIRTAPRRRNEPEDSPRPVVNKIMHFVNSNHSFALQAKPEADVLPANDDYLALSDADVANAYIEHLQDPTVGNWRRTLSRATLWALVANTAYIKWTFDRKKKRPSFMFVPSVELFIDPYATDFREARWAIHSQFMDPEQVYDLYDKEVKAPQMEKTDVIKTELLRDMGYAPVMEGVTVNELWMLPSRRYPDGLYVVWAGNETLFGPVPYPYKHGKLPFTAIGVVPRPNSPFYASPVSFLRAPQTELNKYHAQRIAVREAFALYKWWIPDSLDLRNDPDDSPRQVLRGSGSPGEKPEIIGPPGAMPDNNDGAWITEEMMNVAGIHEVSQGQVPGRVEAAQAIELLRESDASRLAELIETTAEAISEGFWQVLMLTKQYVTEPIIVQSYSPEGVAEVKRFKAEQLHPGMRIKVTVGSGLARTRAARMDQLITLWQQGVLRDPEEFSRLADIPVPSILSTRAQDVRLARNENLTLAEGNALTANSWDDHTIHIREHNNYRKTADFQSRADEVKLRFEHHVQEHEQLEIQSMSKDLQKQQMVMQLTGQAGGAQDVGQTQTNAPVDAAAMNEPFNMRPQQGAGSANARKPDISAR
jgi:hypothetical protein